MQGFFFEVLFGGGEASTRKEQDFAKPVKQMEDGDDKLVYSESCAPAVNYVSCAN